MDQILIHIFYGDFFSEFDVEKLNKDSISIGSDESDDIFIQADILKARHVVIEKRLESWIILVPISRSLIYKDKRIDKKFLEDGDTFVIPNKNQSSDSVSILILDKQEFSFSNKSARYSLKDINEITIGRSENNNIIYHNKNVSDYHASIKIGENGEFQAIVKDGDVMHINGRRVDKKILQPGDVIHVWRYKIVFDKAYITVFNIGGSVSVRNLKEILSMELAYPFLQRSPRLEPLLPDEEILIPNPPARISKPNTDFSFWLQLFLPPMVTIIATFAYPRSLVFTLPMAVSTVVISLTNYLSQHKNYKKREKKRNDKYMEIINQIGSKLEWVKGEQKSILLKTHPSLQDSAQMALERSRRLWERAYDDIDFLDTRLGIGKASLCVELRYNESDINIEDDPLKDKPKELFDKYSVVEDIPVSVPLYTACTLGVVGARSDIINIVRSIIMQIASRHSYDEVKIITVFSNDEDEWNWIKWLPHAWDENRKRRFISCDPASTHEMLTQFNDILKKRENILSQSTDDEKERFLPHFVIILADRILTENEAIMKLLTQNNQFLGVSTIFAFDRMEYLPKNCRYILESGDTSGALYEKKQSSKKLTFTPDKVSGADAEAFARSLAPVRLRQMGAALNIPNTVPLLELFDANTAEELNIGVKWSNSETFKSLAVPLGIRDGGEKLLLDLHEKYHGPHGLIAGTTGSGKSELMQSLILSLAVNFHPYDVVFVLIDYKGGGMANLFEGMPHLVGTITNLDGNQITRSLISIKSEIKKRQELLGEYKVNHIDGYQALYKQKKAARPLPHLFIIIDEFAELKSEQPDFMRELVSAARVGRSLGVHLILATQKPSGVVDDQIWSNARFRLCLKVQGREDSNEVLKRPDAANIKQPGRAYLQVGNNEMFDLFQSAWSGARYSPDESSKQNEKTLLKVELDGRRKPLFGSESKPGEKGGITQLEAVLREIINTATRENITKLNGPWLPPLPETLYLSDLLGKDMGRPEKNRWEEAGKWMCPVIGLADSPHEQKQFPVAIDLGREGHLLIYGAPATGKTTLLSTLITSLALTYSPNDLNIYILDFGSRTFNIFSELPHVGGVVMGDEDEKLSKLMKLLKKEIEKRKRLFSEVGVSSLISYRQATGNGMPAIILLLDNYSALAELYPETEEIFVQFSREAGNYGIHLVITANGLSAIRFKISQNFKLAIALQMMDKSDYSGIVGKTNGLEPSPVNGRGLVKIGIPVEFQTALPVRGSNEADRSMEMKSLFDGISKSWKGKRAKSIPILPDILKFRDMLEYDELKYQMQADKGLVPLGLTTEELEPVFIDFGEISCFMVTGQIQSGRTNVLKSFISFLKEKGTLEKSYIIDSNNSGLYQYKSAAGPESYITEADALSSVIEEISAELYLRKNELLSRRKDWEGDFDEKKYIESLPQMILFIDEYIDFYYMADENVKSNLEKLLKKYKGLKFCMVVSGLSEDISSNNYDSLTKAMIECQNGLVIGGSFEQQRVFSSRMPYAEQGKILDAGEAYYLSKGKTSRIKLPLV